MAQITCLTFFKYNSAKEKLWAFGMMQFAHKHFVSAEGLSFYKLMGSGKGMGFNPLPDWSVYTLLTVWESEEQADQFIQNSTLYELYQDHADHIWTLYLNNIKAHGLWSDRNPFQQVAFDSSEDPKICVITRATIKKRYLPKFWKYVPTSSKPLVHNHDLIFTKGIGEVPIIQMATFSIWKNEEALKKFAYQSKEHHKAIQMTRSLGWYREELFARFKIVKTTGEWPGVTF